MTEELTPVQRAGPLAEAALRTYYENYFRSFGKPYFDYMKLLADAAPEDRQLIAEAFSKSYSDNGGSAIKVVMAEMLEISEEKVAELIAWSSPPPRLT